MQGSTGFAVFCLLAASPHHSSVAASATPVLQAASPSPFTVAAATLTSGRQQGGHNPFNLPTLSSLHPDWHVVMTCALLLFRPRAQACSCPPSPTHPVLLIKSRPPLLHLLLLLLLLLPCNAQQRVAVPDCLQPLCSAAALHLDVRQQQHCRQLSALSHSLQEGAVVVGAQLLQPFEG